MVQKPVLLETLSGEISGQAHAGQRPSAAVARFFEGRITSAILRRMICTDCDRVLPYAGGSLLRSS